MILGCIAISHYTGRAGPLTFFHHKPPVSAIADTQPAMRDNRSLIGVVARSAVTKAALEAAPKPFSAQFEELSRYSGILCK